MAQIKGVPHPFPYQGSKRQLASYILAFIPDTIETFYEPFAGSAAVTIAAAYKNKAQRYIINDLHQPVINLWEHIIHNPEELCQKYESIWNAQLGQDREYYDYVRNCFNQTGQSHYFLYLLARCVKSAVRYNRYGEFNNSPDKRRLGMKPQTMRNNIIRVSTFLRDRVKLSCRDYKKILSRAQQGDFVYMDPPYQGVCNVRDHRYCQSVDFDEFCDSLNQLNKRNVAYIVSYDGRTGEKVHGKELPSYLELEKIEIKAGRSTQATLLGRDDYTYESLYVSKAVHVKDCRFAFDRLQNNMPLFCQV